VCGPVEPGIRVIPAFVLVVSRVTPAPPVPAPRSRADAA
jgi:hypothetical protein